MHRGTSAPSTGLGFQNVPALAKIMELVSLLFPLLWFDSLQLKENLQNELVFIQTIFISVFNDVLYYGFWFFKTEMKFKFRKNKVLRASLRFHLM